METILNNPYLPATAVALAVISLLLSAVLIFQFRKYRKIQTELLAGEDGKSLEEIILKNKKTLATHNKNLKELGRLLEELVENNKLNVQKTAMVRFNPFAEAGGNMSFALVFLDGKDNGIVISSLHAREGTRMYSKLITAGQSESHLTEEEKQAIAQAKSSK